MMMQFDMARAREAVAHVERPVARRGFAEELAHADTFVDAAHAVCDAAARLDMRQCVVFLHTQAGPPVLAVDNIPVGVTDDQRLMNVGDREPWRVNPAFVRLRECIEFIGDDALAPDSFQQTAEGLGYTGPRLHVFAAPVIGPAGWFATILCGSLRPQSAAKSLELALLATHLAAWCAAHGTSRVPELAEPSWLSKRQFRIAQLAVAGRTNAQIGVALGISINTVKMRLKQAFSRLGVASRDELSRLMRLLVPLDGVPLGVSKQGSVSVTRDIDVGAWVP
jgi:DNA-binding CsgD family transcriptional regulator